MTSLAKNQNYIMELYQLRQTSPTGGDIVPLSVKANLPEQAGFGIQSRWEARLPSDISSITGRFGQLARMGADLINLSTTFQAGTFQSWTGTEPIEISLELGFRAWSDAQADVIEPMKRLTQMAAPSVFAGFMMSPGPSPFHPNRNRLLLRLGRYLTIQSMVMTRCEHTFTHMLDPNGTPVAGKSDVTLATIDTPSAQDILAFFPGPGDTRTTAQVYSDTSQSLLQNVLKALREVNDLTEQDLIGRGVTIGLQAYKKSLEAFVGLINTN